eukprot:4478848-Pleurochrysis_carterae.AAC.2
MSVEVDPDIVCCVQPEKAVDTIKRSSIFLYEPEFTEHQGRLNEETKQKIVEALRDDPAFAKLPSDWQKMKADNTPGAKAAANNKKPLPQKSKAKTRKARCR